MTDLEKLVHKALNEPAFREKVLKSPKAALTEAGIEATAAKVAALKAALKPMKSLHAVLAGKGRVKGA